MMAMLALCAVGVLFYEGFWLHAGCGVLLGVVWIRVDGLGTIRLTVGFLHIMFYF